MTLTSRLSPLRSLATLLTAGLLSWAANAMPLVSAETALLALINDARGQLGVSALTLNDPMRSAALAASQDMANTGTVSLVGSDGKTVLDRLTDTGYTASPFQPAALVGTGGRDGSAQALVPLWLADATSRQVLTAASATEIGVGLSFDAQSRAYWALVVNPVLANAGGGGGGASGGIPSLDPASCAANLATLARAQCLLDDLRLRQGLQRLALNGPLSTAAAAHSLDMLTHDFVGPTGSDGSLFNQRTAQAGYNGTALGQVVAGAFSSVDAVLSAWLGDATSRDVLLNPLADEFGFGLQASERSNRWTLFTGQADHTVVTLPEPAALALALLALSMLGLVSRPRPARL